MTEVLVYDVLKHTTDTRVLDLLPGSFDHPIECTVRNIELDEADYEAISYVWGDSKEQVAIKCNSQSLSIPVSLHTALKYFRYTDRTRTLWADSVCINQADPIEKGYHVANMGRIYAKAQTVLMWQGEEDAGTNGALSALVEIMETMIAGPEAEGWQTILNHGAHAMRHIKLGHGNPFLQSIKSPNYAAVSNLLKRPYFERLWTLQEAILSTDALLVLGNRSTPFSVVQRAFALLNEDRIRRWPMFEAIQHIISNTNADGAAAIPNLGHMMSMMECSRLEIMHEFGDSSHLVVQLKLAALRKCTDPRDSVFALLNIAADVDLATDHILAPDYTIDAVEVYHRLAIYLLTHVKSYDWLAYARTRVEDDKLFPLPPAAVESWMSAAQSPSWVPLKLNLEQIFTIQYRGTMGLYWSRAGVKTAGFKAGILPDAAGSTCTHLEQEPVLSSDRRTLTMVGRFMDRVALSHIGADVLRMPLTADMLADCRHSMGELKVEPAEIGLMFACWLHNTLKVCLGDSFLTAEIPFEAWLLYARCNQYYPDESIESIAALVDRVSKRYQAAWRREPVDHAAEKEDEAAFNRILVLLVQCSLFKLRQTENGKYALLPRIAQAGDRIVVLNGMTVPLVLREASEGAYTVVGDCAVQGLMDGEALIQQDIAAERILLV